MLVIIALLIITVAISGSLPSRRVLIRRVRILAEGNGRLILLVWICWELLRICPPLLIKNDPEMFHNSVSNSLPCWIQYWRC
tara:strand:+ start:957 stop:1202 length:246 start_codon:yes stop_codon:yes gene_type:complete